MSAGHVARANLRTPPQQPRLRSQSGAATSPAPPHRAFPHRRWPCRPIRGPPEPAGARIPAAFAGAPRRPRRTSPPPPPLHRMPLIASTAGDRAQPARVPLLPIYPAAVPSAAAPDPAASTCRRPATSSPARSPRLLLPCSPSPLNAAPPPLSCGSRHRARRRPPRPRLRPDPGSPCPDLPVPDPRDLVPDSGGRPVVRLRWSRRHHAPARGRSEDLLVPLAPSRGPRPPVGPAPPARFPGPVSLSTVLGRRPG
nr:vegetative cell wall protein gp1-like [Aegilops tauschii subsp. strangulata]